MDLDAWTQMQLELVDMERRAEEAQTAEEQESLNLKQLEERGVVIGSLVLTEQKHGLGGRTLVTLSRSKALGGKKNDKGRTESSGSDPLLPAHCFGGGDIVALRKANMAYVPSSSSKEQELRGLVYRVFENKIVVALDSGKRSGNSLSISAKEGEVVTREGEGKGRGKEGGRRKGGGGSEEGREIKTEG
eukprot:571247-Hanusia_phi.AAC.1